MFPKTVLFAAAAALLAGNAMGGVIAAERPSSSATVDGAEPTAVAVGNELFAGEPVLRVATNPDATCRCPNNCNYKVGSSCQYRASPSNKSSIVKGHCTLGNGGLTCQPR